MPKHFIALSDYSSAELQYIIRLAEHLKLEWRSGGNRPVLAGKVLAMIFQKPSLRTRVSFEVAMKHVGGDAIYLSPMEIGLGTRESIPDVARVLSGLCQGIMARTYQHHHIEELVQWSTVPVVNGLTDYNHPCQAMADILTIKEHFGYLEGLKLAYVGDGNNVATSLIMGAAKFGINFAIATPEGYELPPKVREQAAQVASEQGTEILYTTHLQQAIEQADVVYTDTWTSMGQESEAVTRRQAFEGFQISQNILAIAKKTAIVMHCLPAHRGEEITDAVIDGQQSAIFKQAENRLHAQKAILVHLMAN